MEWGRSAIIIINMVSKHYLRRPLRIAALALSASLLCVNMASASASSANISHSYQSKTAIPAGSLVSLDASSQDYVEPANITNGARAFGIVVNSADSLLAVDTGKGGVQVATNGTAPALVSNVNGDISVGDQIAVSPFDGIGMKASSGSHVVGLAQSAFSATSAGAQMQTIKDTTGASKQIAIGTVNVTIPPGSTNGDGNVNLTSLQKLAQSFTGRVIPTSRIIAALLIAGITLLALIALIYGAIYSAIISIGRNPLAKSAVYRSLATVLGMAVLTASVALGVALLILR